MNRYLTIEQLEVYARGHWLDILARYTSCLDDALSKLGKHVDCPFHGGKKDFRIDKKEGPIKGLSFCTCGTRNGWNLLCEANGWTIIQAKDAVAEYFNLYSKSDEEKKRAFIKAQRAEKERLRRKAIKDAEEVKTIAAKRNAVWNKATPLSDDKSELARVYLKSRKLDPSRVTSHIRFHPAMPLLSEEGDILGFHPAILSRVCNNQGKPVTLHRTYLDRETGLKLDSENAKKLMPVPNLWSDTQGRMIPVTEVGDSSILGIAEGVETALAASMASGIPVWATVSAGPMMSFIPPKEISMLVIFADLDRSKTGENAAKTLIENLKLIGWKGKVVVQIPDDHYLTDDKKGVDWADVWFEGKEISFNSGREIHELTA